MRLEGQESRLKELFQNFCIGIADSDGYLDKSQVQKCLSTLGIKLPEEQLALIKGEQIRFEAFKAIVETAYRLSFVTVVLQNVNLVSILEPDLPQTPEKIANLSVAELITLLSNGQFIHRFAEQISKALKDHALLAQAAVSARDANSKFCVEGSFKAVHGGDSVFLGGLENAVGNPDPHIMRAIFQEHTLSSDSYSGFITSNYKLFTTPAVEMAFLVGREDDSRFLHEIADGHHGCKGPSPDELKELEPCFRRAQKLNDEITRANNGVYPGQVGDVLHETEVTFEVFGLSPEAGPSLPKHLTASLRKHCIEALPCAGNGIAADKDFEFAAFSAAEYSARLAMVEVKHVLGESSRFIMSTVFPSVRGSATSIDREQFAHIMTVSLQAAFSEQSEAARCLQTSLPSVSVVSMQEKIWMYVEEPAPGSLQRHGRRRMTLRELMSVPIVGKAQMRVEEALCGQAYTGPMFMRYNAVLRSVQTDGEGRVVGFKSADNKYTTTLHCLTSAVIKIGRVTPLPKERKLWRGLGGMALDERLFFDEDDRGTRGGVELAFMSTTTNKSIAMQYSGQSVHRGIVLEIDYDKVNCPARFDPISLYPGEGEMLFSPLSSLEHVGEPRLESYNGERVVVLSTRINKNPNARTIEQVICLRQELLLTNIDNLIREVAFDLKSLPFKAEIAPDQEEESVSPLRQLQSTVKSRSPEWFNRDENFKKSWNEALDTKIAAVFRFWAPEFLKEQPPEELDRVVQAWSQKYSQQAFSTSMARYAIGMNIIESDVNERNEDLEPVLVTLAKEGKRLEVQTLLFAGVAIDARNKSNETALLVACRQSHWQIASALLRAKASPNVVGSDMAKHPLHYAARAARADLVRELIAAGADVNAEQDPPPAERFGCCSVVASSMAFFCYTIVVCCSVIIGPALLATGLADAITGMTVFGAILTGISALCCFAACSWGRFLQRQAKANLNYDASTTPLHHAARVGSAETVAALLMAGADVRMRDGQGKTALVRAPPECQALLRGAGAKADCCYCSCCVGTRGNRRPERRASLEGKKAIRVGPAEAVHLV